MIDGDRVVVSVRVEVPQVRCFALFTEDIDAWWRHGRAYRSSGTRRSVLHLEPRTGGRLFETFEDRKGRTRVIQTGTVRRFEPPDLLELQWRAINFRSDEATRVMVTFEDLGEATMVRVVHDGWATIRPDHPARHGKPTRDFLRGLGLWWGALLRSLQERALTPPAP